MSDSITFTSSDKKHTFTVKSEFLVKCPNPSEQDTFNLLTKFKVNQYLHSESRPAIIREQDKYSEYWVNGKKLSAEESKKIEHKETFNTTLDDLLD